VAAGDVEGLRFVRAHGALPVVADESCVTAADAARLAAAGAVDGVNLKLSKCGGLREALRSSPWPRARLLVMCGCMIETSLGITAAATSRPLLDAADLDGAALLAHDPYEGATIVGGVVALPDGRASACCPGPPPPARDGPTAGGAVGVGTGARPRGRLRARRVHRRGPCPCSGSPPHSRARCSSP
jgi:hypothetical protein